MRLNSCSILPTGPCNGQGVYVGSLPCDVDSQITLAESFFADVSS
jgi:hypothetical protein